MRKEVLERKAEAKSWELQALGSNTLPMFCYNCAETGHLGDDCPRPMGTKAPITAYPTAFSSTMARRGPYAASNASIQSMRSQARSAGTHTRFDEDLPGANPGFAGFGGAAPGRRGREKEAARQRDLDRRDDRDDWFSGRDRDRGRDNRDNRRGGWSRQRSPERRSAPSLASRITGPAPRFGAMSAPGSRPGPSYRSDRDRGGRYSGEAEIEEGEWRASGAGGGRVEGWGAEMDRADRDSRRNRDNRMRDDRPQAGPSRRGGAARGQRYTGGY